MTTVAVNVKDISDTCKEAVVDSVLGNLAARVSGVGTYHRIISGQRPSGMLVSGFIVPLPEEKRDGDEEADPIRISAHGMDFQIAAGAKQVGMRCKLTGSVYVRLLPTAKDVGPDGPLTPVFPLTSEKKKALREEIFRQLDLLRQELNVQKWKEYANPDWAKRSVELRREVHKAMGVKFEVTQIESTTEPEDWDDSSAENGAEGENVASGASQMEPPVHEESAGESAYIAIAPPEKWLRLDLVLPEFEFTAKNATEDAKTASALLNQSIASQLQAWFDSDDPEFCGRLWGYRKGCKILPSDTQNWQHFLDVVRESDDRPVVPAFNLQWTVNVATDLLSPDRLSVHLAIENHTEPPGKRTYKELECSFFQVSLRLELPAEILRKLTLDRVKPSYRYNKYLRYPALGFNGGVSLQSYDATSVLTTTWTPRYVLPRMVPTEVGVELRFDALSHPEGLAGLTPLVEELELWIERARRTKVDEGIDDDDDGIKLASERRKLAEDLRAWERELGAIRAGVALLQESATFWSGPGLQKDPRGIPCEAWLAMNAAMRTVGGAKYSSWRLFQLAFVVSMVPTFSTRVPELHHYYRDDVEAQANAVTLLYFPTGGGKSEAFLGLLGFVLFVDRLRGKERGVSALMRYPLRLLTLQQARRTMSVLAACEIQRRNRGQNGDVFSLGFWVGSTNTPNWHRDDLKIPTLAASPLSEESVLKDTRPYASYRSQWLKLEQCPFCKSAAPVALRRVPANGGLLGHFCTSEPSDCAWNGFHAFPAALPFYIVDEDIYALSPTVLLGTIDKLAVIGQSYRTIRYVFGMFGLAPFQERSTGRLHTPLTRIQWETAASGDFDPLYPAFKDGTKKYFDPFPSLLIQDEAHLLEESLGTFAGLFESALEAALDRLAPILGAELSREPSSERRRRIKVIAASATVSEPQRQMRNLYQRDDTLQFPHPGPDLYSSFYSEPKSPNAHDLANRERLLTDDIEVRCHRGRVYAAILTNGHKHTVAMSSILGNYHLCITEIYEALRSGESSRVAIARQLLTAWVTESPLANDFRAALESASAGTLLSIIDLLRISLTYVTNKKGGDQLIDTERTQFDELHRSHGFWEEELRTALISGAVSASDIQAVVRQAENRVKPGEHFPQLSDTLRSIIATSAVSHGVDVEEFNAMFFAGLPSDIAEYIQASSRVGRTHVGFSLLVPVPQRGRDRFVVEIFDIFHRFLERMVLPAAVDRWAEKAIKRVIPSILQEYLCGVSRIQSIAEAGVDRKSEVRDLRKTGDVLRYLSEPEHMDSLTVFVADALGLTLRPPPEGLAYYRSFIRTELSNYRKSMEEPRLENSDFRNFFEKVDQSLRPMTSLRDVDQPGWISQSRHDFSGKRVRDGDTEQAMSFIRHGIGNELDDDGDTPD
jgi:hypothetical protein